MSVKALIDTFPYGLLICDYQRKVVVANQCASVMLGECGQTFEVGHSIPYMQTSNSKGLQDAVLGALKGLVQMIVLQDASGGRVMVSVAPITLDDGTQGVIVTTEPSPLCMSETVSVYADHRQLSTAETRTLLVLCQGSSPQETAGELSLAISTVRSHISAILTKTESACLRSLVAKVAKLPRVVGFSRS